MANGPKVKKKSKNLGNYYASQVRPQSFVLRRRRLFSLSLPIFLLTYKIPARFPFTFTDLFSILVLLLYLGFVKNENFASTRSQKSLIRSSPCSIYYTIDETISKNLTSRFKVFSKYLSQHNNFPGHI